MKSDRDIEKSYSGKEFVESCGGLPMPLNLARNLRFKLVANGSMFRQGQLTASSMSEGTVARRSSFRLSGRIRAGG